MAIDFQQLSRALSSFAGMNVLVIGDSVLDRSLLGEIPAANEAAPVVQISRQYDYPGGAANCAVNIAALGGKPYLLTVVGTDCSGAHLLSLLALSGVRTQFVAEERHCRTAERKRVLAGPELIVRCDVGSPARPGIAGERKIISALSALYHTVDAVVLCASGGRVITPAIAGHLCKLQEQHRKAVAIDSPGRLPWFKPLNPRMVKLTAGEAACFLQPPPGTAGFDAASGERLLAATGASLVAVTLGSEGAIVFTPGYAPERLHCSAASERGARGAADVFMAAAGLAAGAGLDPCITLCLASAAANVAVKKDSAPVCGAQELLDYLDTGSKLDLIAAAAGQCKHENRRIVFTHGVFSGRQSAHADFLQRARSLGDVLIVALQHGGSNISPLAERIEFLSKLGVVDHLLLCEGGDASGLLQSIKPDVYVRGAPEKGSDFPESALVRKLGGQVVYFPRQEAGLRTAGRRLKTADKRRDQETNI